jgi:RHS repeat-associated protein
MISRVALPNNGQTYRFGFNGKENDNGVKGLGNQQDYGMRIYDPRVGRFLSVDPLTKNYPWYTPYQFAGNSPIANIDLDGAEPRPAGKGTEEGQTQTTEETKEIPTPGGQAGCSDCLTRLEHNKQQWYWHEGGLLTGQTLNKDKTAYVNTYTAAGWYTSEEYVEVLSRSYAVKALASNLGLYNYTSEKGNEVAISKGQQELQKYAGGGINERAAVHLLSAAKQTAKQSNFNSSGTINFSAVNVEDFFGLAALAKSGLERLATKTLYRVVSPGEAADVMLHGFRQAPIEAKISSYEGKLFWGTGENAKWYHNWAGSDNVVLKIKVDKGFIFELGEDVGRRFYFVSPERLEEFNKAIKSIKQVKL